MRRVVRPYYSNRTATEMRFDTGLDSGTVTLGAPLRARPDECLDWLLIVGHPLGSSITNRPDLIVAWTSGARLCGRIR
jgi:hypothetical protein